MFFRRGRLLAELSQSASSAYGTRGEIASSRGSEVRAFFEMSDRSSAIAWAAGGTRSIYSSILETLCLRAFDLARASISAIRRGTARRRLRR